LWIKRCRLAYKRDAAVSHTPDRGKRLIAFIRKPRVIKRRQLLSGRERDNLRRKVKVRRAFCPIPGRKEKSVAAQQNLKTLDPGPSEGDYCAGFESANARRHEMTSQEALECGDKFVCIKIPSGSEYDADVALVQAAAPRARR
jgi:hypothetical protein